MLRKFLCFAALAAFVAPVQAGLLSSLLTFNGLHDTLIDQSVDGFIDNDSNGLLSFGDVLYGVAQVDSINVDSTGTVPLPPVNIAIAFAVQVTEVTTIFATADVGIRQHVNFGAVTAATQQLGSLLGPGYGLSADKIFGVFERVGGTQPIDFSNSGGATPDGLKAITTGGPEPWTYVASGGFSTVSDFFQARLDYDDNVNNGVLDGLSFSGGLQRGGFSITDHTFGGSTVFLPVSVDHIAGAGTGFGVGPTTHDLVILGGSTVSPANTPQSTNGWEFENNASYRLNPVPEPGSVAIWSLVVLGTAVARRRRKK